jgi:hypothetical protein
MVIAERTLLLKSSDTSVRIPVTIFLPKKTASAWGCRYQIDWPGGIRSSEVFGFDSMQALLHAMQAVGAEVYTSDAHRSGQLRWTDEDDGYGFPVPSLMRDQLTKGDSQYL